MSVPTIRRLVQNCVKSRDDTNRVGRLRGSSVQRQLNAYGVEEQMTLAQLKQLQNMGLRS
jgi:hypothetical protein